jgi:hypothetical protein
MSESKPFSAVVKNVKQFSDILDLLNLASEDNFATVAISSDGLHVSQVSHDKVYY